MTHLAAFALAGACTSGVGGALWLRHLEARVGPAALPALSGRELAVIKALCDCLCYGTTVITLNLLLVPLLCGVAPDAALANAQAQLPHLLGLELLLFGPFNLALFSRPDLVPPSLRPMVVQFAKSQGGKRPRE